MVITLKTCKKTQDMMNEFYLEQKRAKTPQYALFQADDGDTVVTLYTSGKAVFQGNDADIASEYWIETEKINSGTAIVTNSDDKSKKTLKGEEKKNTSIYHNVNRRVWLKWMMNLAINQISAYGNYTYKDMSDPEILDLMYHVFDEGYIVASAYNIGVTRGDIDELKYRCSLFESDRVTSLTLDVNKGGLNEAAIFGGRMLELAKEKNIDIPYNKMVYERLLNRINKNK